jgi:hypothetical protein
VYDRAVRATLALLIGLLAPRLAGADCRRPPCATGARTDARGCCLAAPRPVAACPAGQARTADTAGNCCWPAQVWSKVQSRCVGIPRCPTGLDPVGESCAAKPVVTTPSCRAGQHWDEPRKQCRCPAGEVDRDGKICVKFNDFVLVPGRGLGKLVLGKSIDADVRRIYGNRVNATDVYLSHLGDPEDLVGIPSEFRFDQGVLVGISATRPPFRTDKIAFGATEGELLRAYGKPPYRYVNTEGNVRIVYSNCEFNVVKGQVSYIYIFLPGPQ